MAPPSLGGFTFTVMAVALTVGQFITWNGTTWTESAFGKFLKPENLIRQNIGRAFNQGSAGSFLRSEPVLAVG